MRTTATTRARALAGAVAVTGAGLLATPAVAVVSEPPTFPRTITTLTSSAGVDVSGYDAGDLLTVSVRRGRFVVATTGAAVASDTGAGIGVLVNHPPPTGPTTCWQGPVPVISAGDVIAVTRQNGDVDQMRVADIGLTSTPALIGGKVEFTGFARTAAGDRLPDLFNLTQPGLTAEIRAPKGTSFSGGNVIAASFVPGAQGTLSWQGSSTTWRASWSLANPADEALALAGPPKKSSPAVSWTGDTGTDVTIADAAVVLAPDIRCESVATTVGKPGIPDLVDASDTGASSTDDLTTDVTPTLEGASGRSRVGDTVQILVDGTVATTTTIGPDKTWSATLPALGDGTHRITMRETTPATGVSGALGLTIDTTPPAAPSLTTDPAGPADQNAPRVTGTAEPGSTVRVYAGAGCGGAPVATGGASALAAGFPMAVADDSLTTWSATATDALGNVSACSVSTTFIEQSTKPAGVVTVLGGRLPLSSAWRTRVSLTCTGPVGAVCFGRLALVSRVDVDRGPRVKMRQVEVGSKAFAIRAGRTSSVLVTLARAARPLVLSAGSLRARVTITTSIGSGPVSVGRRVVTLVAPAR